MSTGFESLLAADAEKVFCNSAEMGESLVHTSSSGTATTFTGVVERDPPFEVKTSDGSLKRPKMLIHIPVAKVASIDSGGDTVTVAYRLGGTAVAYQIGAPLRQDSGLWVVPVL